MTEPTPEEIRTDAHIQLEPDEDDWHELVDRAPVVHLEEPEPDE